MTDCAVVVGGYGVVRRRGSMQQEFGGYPFQKGELKTEAQVRDPLYHLLRAMLHDTRGLLSAYSLLE